MLPQLFLLLLTIPKLTEEERTITTTKYSAFRVTPTIVQGTPVQKGQLPYLVSIKQPIQKFSNNRKLWSNLCGGSIIAPLKVLTAAHCFEARHFYFAKNYKLLRVVAGNLKDDLIHSGHSQTNGVQWRSIDKVTLHRDFQFPSHDIALVIVDSDFIYTEAVDYIIPAGSMTDYTATCISAGFGQTGHGPRYKVSKELLRADISLLSRKQCDTWWEMNMDTFICTNSLISDVSEGDSGGPLSCYGTLDPAEKRGKDLLVGIVSGKNHDKTTLFTRVSAYKGWLEAGGCSPREVSKFVFSLCFIITLLYIRLLNLFI